jgi:hypothetical protein
MTARIREMTVEMPGRVLRRFDGTNTMIAVTEDQARALLEQLSPVLHFFDSQQKSNGDDVAHEVKSGHIFSDS